jgi:hypothetical protein
MTLTDELPAYRLAASWVPSLETTSDYPCLPMLSKSNSGIQRHVQRPRASNAGGSIAIAANASCVGVECAPPAEEDEVSPASEGLADEDA